MPNKMENTNFEIAMESIGQAIFEMFDTDTPKEVTTLLTNVEDSYVLVQWPESQGYMEEEWFDKESIFCGGSEEKTVSSAYFIPLKRII